MIAPDEMEALRQQVVELRRAHMQLTDTLKTAGIPLAPERDCGQCEGTGEVAVFSSLRPCPLCDATGRAFR